MRLLDSLEKLNNSFKNKDYEFMSHITDFQKENAFSMNTSDNSLNQLSKSNKKHNLIELTKMQNTDISENSFNFLNSDNTLTTSFTGISEIDNIIKKNIDFRCTSDE